MKKNMTFLSAILILFLQHGIAFADTTTLAQTTTTVTTTSAVTNSEAAVINVAQTAALAIFNYDYQNYRERLQSAATNFSPQGWNSYLQALTESGNLGIMQLHKVAMSGQITGTATITQLASPADQQQWLVQIPMLVVYTSGNGEKIIHNLIVKLVVGTVDPKINARGLVVKQVIAAPNVTPSPL